MTATHILVDVHEDDGIKRRVFPAEEAEAAHAWAKSKVNKSKYLGARRVVSLRPAWMNADGYFVEGE